MSGVWAIAAAVLLPIPLVFLLLLSLPSPVSVKKLIMNFCSKTLALQSFGVFTLFDFMMAVSTITFVVQVWATHQMNSRYQQQRAMDLSPCEKTQLYADKWRHERNFWLSALVVTLWIVLNRFYRLNLKNMELRDRLKATTASPTPSAPPIPSDPLAPVGTENKEGKKQS